MSSLWWQCIISPNGWRVGLLKWKEVVEVARSLYEDISCRHECVAIQINDQGKELVSSVSAEFWNSGLLERNNRTIQNALRTLSDRYENWASVRICFVCTEVGGGVCFCPNLFLWLSMNTLTHELNFLIFIIIFIRSTSTVQASTKFSPFKMLCGRESILHIYVDHKFADCASDSDDPEFSLRRLTSMLHSQNSIYYRPVLFCKGVEQREKSCYMYVIYILVDMRHNLRRVDRKGSKQIDPWDGPEPDEVTQACEEVQYGLVSTSTKIPLKTEVIGCKLKFFEITMKTSALKLPSVGPFSLSPSGQILRLRERRLPKCSRRWLLQCSAQSATTQVDVWHFRESLVHTEK